MKLLLLLLVVALSVALWVRGARMIRASRACAAACGRCGCPVGKLIGRETACPECGAAFAEAGITPARDPSPTARWMGMVLIALPFAIWALLVMFTLVALGRWP
jgi:hypothetical protein